MTDFCSCFETGPIRPPSEATSLLVRVTRNCPWNRCTFCPVYKGERFSLRSVAEVKGDIDALAALTERVAELLWLAERGRIGGAALRQRLALEGGRRAAQVALFLRAGAQSVFLQDANSLIVPVDRLVELLEYLRGAFPTVTRVTTYARSHTLIGRSCEDLKRLREAGLDRVHVGLESGSDRVLERVAKGATAARHIEAGRRVKAAGMELSEYVMPGLGGRDLSAEHARETARVLNAIDPHFVRLRTLAVSPGSPLDEELQRGDFEPLSQLEVVEETRELIASLTDVTGVVISDHVLNPLEEVEGQLPEARDRMLAVFDRFLALPPDERDLFLVGRRIGVFRRLDDLEAPTPRAQAKLAVQALRQRFGDDLDRAMLELTRGML